MVPEFGTGGPGFAIHDAEVDTMSGACARPVCAYFVVEHDGTVLGRGGLTPLEHGDAATRELRKTCFLATLRGLGIDHALGDTGHHACNRFCLRELWAAPRGARRRIARP